MHKNTKLSIVLLCGLLLLSPLVQAAGAPNRVVWTEKQNAYSGLYTTRNYFVTNGISLSFFGMYFFGDVDNEGLAFNGGFNMNNLSLGGGVNFAYSYPLGNHCNLRASILGGTLRGNNELKFKSLPEPRDDYRKFRSIIIQPSVGVQYYPFSNAGFYLYGGIALTASIITKYQFYYYNDHFYDRDPNRHVVEGSTFGFLPMVQLGLGYTFRLSESWSLGLELSVQEGLIDIPYMNLDAWPLAPSQNSDGVELGKSFGTWIDRYGKEHIHWNDGWFQVGLTITYCWRNCEHCRILNAYQNIRMRH